jgi:capsular exopolysaccharide synthesis family protein
MERIREALKRAREEGHAKIIGLGSAAAALGEDNRVPADADLSQIPAVKVSRESLFANRVVTAGARQTAQTHAFKMLSTQVLQLMRQNAWTNVLVTSTSKREGKTLVSVNLALSLAMEVDQGVLLIDADLGDPAIHRYFHLPPQGGLSDYLLARTPVKQLLVRPDIDRLTLLPAGKPLANSSEMLGSPRMAELVQELKVLFRHCIVVFDMPSALSSADVIAFGPLVDAALLVVEDGKTKSEDVRRAAQLLGGKLIGVVLNKSAQRPNHH